MIQDLSDVVAVPDTGQDRTPTLLILSVSERQIVAPIRMIPIMQQINSLD